MSPYKQSASMALVWSLSLLITLFIHILNVAIHQRMLHGKTSKQKQQYPAYCRVKLWQISPTRLLLEKLSELLLFSCLRWKAPYWLPIFVYFYIWIIRAGFSRQSWSRRNNRFVCPETHIWSTDSLFLHYCGNFPEKGGPKIAVKIS